MVETVIKSFEGLIRRGLAPSVTFFVLAVLGDLLRVELTDRMDLAGGSVEKRLQEYVNAVEWGADLPPAVLVTFALLAVLGFSHGLMAIQQVVFDDWLKRDFDSRARLNKSKKSEVQALVELRKEVWSRIRKEPCLARLRWLKEPSDYILYEILGGIDTMDTRPFVDSAKALGVVFVSAIIILLANGVIVILQLGWGLPAMLGVAILVVGVVLLWRWGREATRAQYRARALRLYVNFLAMPSERIHSRLRWPEGGRPALASGEEGAP